MNFNQIIKQEWEKEFPLGVDNQPPVFGNSIFTMYEPMVERICIRVWNQALELAAEEAEWGCFDVEDGGCVEEVDKQSILNLKLDEQGTDTTEV